MNKTTKFLAAASIVATSFGANIVDSQAAAGKEKCYGVVKASKNDCAAKDGSHSCAAQAKEDAGPNEWVYVPEGLCERLTGGVKG